MSASPRILLVNYEYPPLGGGAGTATAGMARALAQAGCDIVVMTSRFRGQPAREEVDGYRIVRVPVIRRRPDRCTPPEMLVFMASAAVHALRMTRHWVPDLTIAFFGIPGGPVGWVLRATRGVPYIVSLRGGDVPGFNWAPGMQVYHRLTAPVIRFLWRRARAVVANGEGLRQLAEAALPGLSVPVVPNGVDAERNRPSAAVPKSSAAGTPRLLIVGRLVHQKGIDILLRALATLPRDAFELEVVGDGPDRAALKDLANRLGVADRVRFAGWVERDRIAEHYRAADAFVFPSRLEGMPNVVLEAMAFALPVIATDVPGNRDVVVHGSTGLLVESENVDQLAAALRQILSQPSLRQQMGAAARARVLERHTWAAGAAEYLRLGGVALHGPAHAQPAAFVGGR